MSHPLLDALRRQHQHLLDHTARSGWLPRHQPREPALQSFKNLTDVQATVHNVSTPTETIDGVFAAFLRIHHAGDATAGQFLIGLLLPAIARHRRRDASGEDHLAQLLTELWHGICSYPLARRPRRIPANLTLDARQRATRALRDAPTTTCLPDALEQPDSTRAFQQVDDRAVLLTAARRSRLSDADLQLISATRIAGARITDIAVGCEVDRLRQRRHRAELRMRSQLLA